MHRLRDVATAVLLVWPVAGWAQFNTPKPISDDQSDEASAPASAQDEAAPEPAPVPKPKSPRAAKSTAEKSAPTEKAVSETPASAAPEPAPSKPATEAAPATGSEAPVALVPPKTSEDDILKAWRERQKAVANLDFHTIRETEKQISQIRDDLVIPNLFSISDALVRESSKLLTGDPVEGLRRAEWAADLSPDFPVAQVTVARAAFAASPLNVGRIWPALIKGLEAVARDRRWRDGAILDLFAAALSAIIASFALFTAVVFLRHVRYFFHDVNHLFPKGVSELQTSILAAMVLAAPVVFRLGPFAILATLLAAAWLYMSTSERIVATFLVGAVAAIPLAVSPVLQTVGINNEGEDVYLVEHAGLEAEPAARRLGNSVKVNQASVAGLAALGRWQRRHGRFHEAADLLTKAAQSMPSSAEIVLELGIAQFLDGNLEGSRISFASALEKRPGFPEALYDLSVVTARRAQSMATGVLELDKAKELAQKAAQSSSLMAKRVLAGLQEHRTNHVLASVELPEEALAALRLSEANADRVADHLRRRLFGAFPEKAGPFAPFAVIAALWLLALIGRAVLPSAECLRCGRPACRRCDHDVSGGRLCGQCVTVFAHTRSAIEPAVRVAKEIGIRRYQRRQVRIQGVTALLCAGAGHLWKGRTAVGSLLLFGFAFLAFNLVFRDGVVRPPIGTEPVLLKVLPPAIGLVLVYFYSLRGIFFASED
jgi:hypothetical protein